MLDEDQRTTILQLYARGRAKRQIARLLGVSRGAVQQVIKSGRKQAARLNRAELAEPYQDDIVALLPECRGNLIRVHEKLLEDGAELSYQALTAYCRRHHIGHAPPEPAGRYPHVPGVEMQHDTSPDYAKIGGRERRVQIAGLALAYSRFFYIQLYPRFTRFECKVFFDDALDYVGGVCPKCMVDNTAVIVLRGTGADMVPVPEMEAFAEHRGFEFVAHEKGDANRSAVVEGLFNHVQKNFLAGREFDDWDHANREAVIWCDKVNATFSRKLHASRRELFAAEQPILRPLPAWRPEVYRLEHRIVDLEGYVNLHGFKYSVPYRLIGRPLEIRETKRELRVFDGPRLVATHIRRLEGPRRVRLPEHRPPRGALLRPDQPLPEVQHVLKTAPELGDYVRQLVRRTSRPRSRIALRRLRRMLEDYPRQACLRAMNDAERYGLYDLERVERMALRNVRDDFFPNLPERFIHGTDDEEAGDE